MRVTISILFVFLITRLSAQVDCLTNYSGTFNNSGNPRHFIEYDGWLYFTAKSDGTNYELWRTNGMSGVTELFADIGSMNWGSSPDYFVIFQSELYFIANNFIDGIQLWKTDGTVDGTIAVTKFNYPIGVSSSTGFTSLTVFNNNLFFIRYDYMLGTELWKSDGTWSGTQVVKDINVGVPGSVTESTAGLKSIGNDLFFFADDGIHGTELWKTDGTESGTNLVKDINSGAASSGSYDPSLTVFNDTLYFVALTAAYGREIWKSDGTESGTAILVDVYSGTNSADPEYLTVSGNQLFFSALYINGQSKELWRTDGSATGTFLVKNVSPTIYSGSPEYVANANGTLYFSHNDNVNGVELWKSDGTFSGTVMVKNINPSSSSDPMNFYYYNGYTYFQASDGTNGQELWRTDGTNSGTTLVANINGGFTGSLPSNFIEYNGYLIFRATKNSTVNYEPWITNGTAAGTINLRNILTADNYDDVADFGQVFKNSLYFEAVLSGSIKLCASLGTAATTGLFSNLATNPRNYHVVNNRMFFYGSSGVYRTNGTAAGTALVAPISYPSIPTYVYGTLNGKYAYFTTNNTATVINLYVCDSNSAPVLVKSISNASMNDSYNPFECVTMNNILYFSMETTSAGRELWRSDGTNAGTYLLKNIAAGSTDGNPKTLTPYANKLYFSADDGVNGNEVWQSDGTLAGTVLLKNIFPGNASCYPKNFVVYNDTLYFSADDGISGRELWKTDGTEAGTVLYSDIEPGTGSSNPFSTISGLTGMYFSAFTENTGRELWVKKENSSPQIVSNIGPGRFSGNPNNLTFIDNLLYFTANNEVHGYEPYVTLGSECSTSMIEDANPGDKGSQPYFFGNVNGRIVVRAETDLNNLEVYAFNAPSQHTDTVYACQKYYWPPLNDTLENSGHYSVLLTSTSGCDSITNLKLTIGQPSNNIQTVTACNSFTWIDGNTYTASNSSATHTLTSITGCDSVVQLNLTVNSTVTTFDTIVACNSYLWNANNSSITASGDYSATLTALNGCDSLVFLNAIIKQSSSSTAIVSACNSYTWVNGITYTQSTNYPIWHYVNSQGCDSAVTLNLTILSNSSIDHQTACESFTWIDGITYTTSTNLPTWTLTNVSGCDSIISLHLTINNETSVDVRNACNSYTWIDGITYFESTNSPSWTLQNIYGCDSVISLDLTIGNTTTVDVQTACSSFTWINGVTYTSSTNTPTFVMQGATGCDSIIMLDLTINSSSSGTDTQIACDSFTWINGITYNTSTSVPTFVIQNASACDSIVTLHLTINNSSSGTDIQTACGQFTWIDGNTYSFSTNTPTYTLTNSSGCDSTITLNLTINPISTAGISYDGFGTLTASGGNVVSWIDCSNNTVIAGQTGNTFSPTIDGEYAAVVVENGSICPDTSSCIIVDNLGIANLSNWNVHLYPNPTNDLVTISFTQESAELKIYDALGKLIQTCTITSGTQVSLRDVETGVYFFELSTESGRLVKRVVKN